MKLYKYKPIDQYIDNILITNVIWFSKRKILNDPEDLLLEVQNDVTVDIYKEFLIKKSREMERPKKFLRDNFRQGFDSKGLSDVAKKRIEKALKKMKARFDKLGILSLSEDADSEPLWNEYADKKKGICLEFELPQNDYLLKVRYVESRSILKLSKLLLGEDSERILIDVLRTKTIKHSHENEWRYFIRKGNVEFNFIGNITGLRFGTMTDPKHKEKIMRLIDSSGKKIRIYN